MLVDSTSRAFQQVRLPDIADCLMARALQVVYDCESCSLKQILPADGRPFVPDSAD